MGSFLNENLYDLYLILNFIRFLLIEFLLNFKLFLLFIISLFAFKILSAQGQLWKTQLQVKILSVDKDTLVLDSLSILPHTFSVQNIDTSYYRLDFAKSILYWKKKPAQDSIQVVYQTFPYQLKHKYFHKDVEKIEQNMSMTPFYYDAVDASTNKNFVDFGSVDYAGSFGRALSFGNSQDVILNSQFNLQFDGDLGDSIKIIGAITDNNIPFQPQGNTQQIQEFDKVFIQLKRKKTALTVGDYDIKKPTGYFMNFYKRVQGAMVSSTFKTTENSENKIAIGASLAKGKFVRNTITALEGNQGPYKLTGPNGEQFFIVLAGTERVFVDGVLLKRGEDLDYIIDYNTAEVVFMPRRMITKDMRIQIEFEFSDRNYLNSLIYLNDEWTYKNKFQFRLNVFSNQDAKNQGIQQTLDSTQKRFLANIGDSIHQAFYPSVTYQDTFSNNKILYKKMDTIVQGILYAPIYVYSTNPDSAKYYLSFSSVGQGNGNYIQSINNANGRVYVWVSPVNGIKQGDYEPVIVLVTPKKQQMVTAAMQYQIDSNKNLMIETAISNNNPNTFSTIDNQTHTGFAGKILYEEKRMVSHSHSIYLQSKVNYEFVQNQFKALERFRNVEFNRDWNLTSANISENENLGMISVALLHSESKKIEYQFGTYLRGNSFKGYQHNALLQYAENGYHFIAKTNFMTQSSELQKSNFIRPSLDLEKQFKSFNNFTIGSKFLMEHNALKNSLADTLLHNAFSFDALSFFVKSNTAKENNVGIDYTLRHDRSVKNNEFKQNSLSNTFSVNTQIHSLKNQEIRFTGSYRKLNVTDTTITNIKPEESLLGRLEYSFSLWKGILTGNAQYEMGAGQEPKREFTYVKVVAGQGQYVWKDYNKDSIQQLNEFELAQFQDEKLYIRIYTPTNQYLKAKYAMYNHSLAINPKLLFHETSLKGIKKIIAAFYFQSTMQINNRFIGKQGVEQYNPFVAVSSDTSLINASDIITNSIFFNRFNNLWGMDYVNTLNAGKTLMTYGVDGRNSNEHFLRLRFNATKKITLELNLKKALRTYSSFFLENKNYRIHQESVEPKISWLLINNQLRLQLGYKYDVKQNSKWFGNEKATMNNFNLEAQYNVITTGSIRSQITYADLHYIGMSNTSLSYTMLEGLQNGKNILWKISFDKQVSKNIEMSIQYEGRKPSGTPAIHTGRATVRAIF